MYTGFDLAFRTTSLEAAATMDISPIFSGNTQVAGFALLFDAMLSTDFRKLVTLPSGYAYEKRKGTGVRVAMRMTQIKGDVRLTFASVAAQTKLGSAKTQYRVEGIGLSEEVIKSFLDVPLSGELDDGTFGAVRTALAVKLPEYLESEAVGVGDYSVPVSQLSHRPEQRSHAICYAAAMVARRMGLKDAVDRRPRDTSPEAVVVAYARLAGTADTSSNEKPTALQADRAGRWLATGSLEP